MSTPISNIPIKQNFGITGEMSMTGNAMAIGGLDHKIIGSIKSGVNEFIYPEENKRNFEKFIEKYKERQEIEGCTFHEVKHINEVFELIFDK